MIEFKLVYIIINIKFAVMPVAMCSESSSICVVEMIKLNDK